MFTARHACIRWILATLGKMCISTGHKKKKDRSSYQRYQEYDQESRLEGVQNPSRKQEVRVALVF